MTKEHSSQQAPDVKEEPDPELSIPKSSVPNYQTNAVKQTKGGELRRSFRGQKGTLTYKRFICGSLQVLCELCDINTLC